MERRAKSSVQRIGAGAKRRLPSADGRTPLMRSSNFKIVTSTRFAERNGRGREGERADRKPVERANRVLVTSSISSNR